MPDLPEGILIRDLVSMDDFLACLAMQDETWGSEFAERVPPAILRVAQYIGGVNAGAFDDAGVMIGFVFGMTGVRDGMLVHWSDMLAVRQTYRDHHIGAALKEYQRRKVAALGVQRMMWTYDPLVARNAHLNINRLGAIPAEYVPDMYGSGTGSALHGSLPTDRFIVSWDLGRDHTPVSSADAARTDDAQLPLANPVDSSGVPRFDAAVRGSTGDVRVQIPRDLQDEQRAGGERPLHWRLAVRDSIVPLLARGHRVTRFVPASGDRHPYYVLGAAEPGR